MKNSDEKCSENVGKIEETLGTRRDLSHLKEMNQICTVSLDNQRNFSGPFFLYFIGVHAS